MQDMQSVSDEDAEKCMEILRELERGTRMLNQQYKQMLERIKVDGVNLKEGHPILTLLTREMSSYIRHTTSVMVAKAQGMSLENLPAVWQSVVSRTVIGKLWEVEKKLKYELHKRSSKELSASAPDNPLSLKPDIGNFDLADDDDDDDADGGDDGNGDDDDGDGGDDGDSGGGGEGRRSEGVDDRRSDGIYRPSKQFSKFYDEDGGEGKRRKKKMMVRRSVLNDLRSEFTDQPMEVYDGSGVDRMTSRKKEEEKTKYEESHFVRLQLSKKEKMAAKKSVSDDLNFSFGEDASRERKKKRRRKSFKGRKKSGWCGH